MKRVVIKVGSAVLTCDNKIALERMKNLTEFIASLKKEYEVILVTSGAIAAGYSVLKVDKKCPINKKALAAAGQPILMTAYKKYFSEYQINTAQILVTEDDFDSRKRTHMFQNIINTLLTNNILPIINENDTISTYEETFGDNDQLAANVAFVTDADLLVILSDVDGYYNKNPKEYSDASIIKTVHKINPQSLQDGCSANHEFATGGIVTKLKAADFMLNRGRNMFLCNGFNLDSAKSFLIDKNHTLGTLFQPI